MTKQERNTKLSVAEAVAGDRDLIKALMKEALQEVGCYRFDRHRLKLS